MNVDTVFTKKVLVALLVVLSSYAITQDSLKTKTLTLKIEFFQIKDAFNCGLVFNGLNNGIQVIPKAWIKQMVAMQVFLEDADFDFGFYWWIDPVRNIHFTWGHGGQFAFIVPDKNLVVVMTSIPNTQGDYQIDANEALPYVDRIINASF